MLPRSIAPSLPTSSMARRSPFMALVKKVQDGLSRSRTVLVFLSKDFLRKDWPEAELDTALSLEVSGRSVVLPLILGLSHKELEAKHPMVSAKAYEEVRNYVQNNAVPTEELARLVKRLRVRLDSL